MGFFNEIKKAINRGIDWTIDPGGISSDVYHAVTGAPTASEKRGQARLMNEQIQAYKDQTALQTKAFNEAKQQREIEKRRVEEKQIRGMRNRSRAAGFLGVGAAATPLGNATELPSKLGAV